MHDHPETVHRTACPLDCPDTCSVEVTVADGRVAKVDGTHKNPFTDGYVCGKVRNIADHVHGDDRVPHPLLRDGPKGEGVFRRATWDEALDAIAARMLAARDRHGGESIVPCNYGGSNGALTDGALDERLWRRIGASRVAGDLCAQPTGRAAQGMHGRMLGVALSDYVHAKLIVIWGANPASSGIHHVPVVREAQKRGARLVVVDPRRVGLAAQADLHLPLRPGTDLPVALAIANWLFENGHADDAFIAGHTTGVEAFRKKASEWPLGRAAEIANVDESDLETLAGWFAEASPAVVRCGWGLERNRNGGSAVAAVIALPAIGGKFGVRGGGFTMSNSGAIRLDAEAAVRAEAPEVRTVSLKRMGATLLEASAPPVDVLFVYNSNILATAPAQERVRQGMLREDLFTVVFDQVMTDTARYADVVLPATTFLEHDDVRVGYGPLAMVDVRPALPPVGEARPNVDVFADLIRRCGLERPGDPVTADDLRACLVGTDTPMAHALRENGVAFPENVRPVQFVDAFPETEDRKIHLHPEALDGEAGGLYAYKPDPGTDTYPLALISPSTASRVTSTFGQLHRGPVPIELHPDDMASRGLVDGDRVRVHNELSEMLCQVVANDGIPPGVTCQPKGLWSFNTESGNTSNALCPDTSADLGGGACFNDARVQVEKV